MTEKPSLAVSLTLANLGIATDFASTVYGLRRGALQERNPVGLTAGVVIGLGATNGAIVLLHATGHPTAARWTGRACFVFRLAVALFQNLRLSREQVHWSIVVRHGAASPR